MPTAAAPVANDPHASLALTSRPKSAAVGSVARRQWNTPPAELFPPKPRKPAASRRPMSAAVAVPTPPSTATSHSRKATSPRHPSTTVVSPSTGRRLSVHSLQQSLPPSSADACTTQTTTASPRQSQMQPAPASASRRRSSVVAEVQIEAIARGSLKRLSQVTWTRIQKGKHDQTAMESSDDRRDRKSQLSHDQQLQAAAAVRRDVVRSAQVTRTLKKQDVDAEDVRPLIEIAYWSPFLEVRRDAAAALASLSRNPANLHVLSEVGTLGALLSMLSAGDSKVDAAIARDCAQTLASMAKLDAVKLKVLQAPDGVECVFALLHSSDVRLRGVAFELVNNLVTIDEVRQAIAKREGFAFMLESCTAKDPRIRLLAASILNKLAVSPENRFLFYHSSHFQTLADILHDPFIERDAQFRRELLSFIHLLVAEEENGRRFVELHLVPTLLLILDSPKATHAICVLVVSILESLAAHRKNHAALVAANALPRIVTLCFASPRGLPATATDKRSPTGGGGGGSGSGSTSSTTPRIRESYSHNSRSSSTSSSRSGYRIRRPHTASGASRSTGVSDDATSRPPASSMRVSIADMAQLLPMVAACSTAAADIVDASSFSSSHQPQHQPQPHQQQQQPVVISSEVNALLRPAFTVFCEMAKNPVNREHVIRSKLVDWISARNLYAASDKRVRRAVITLLTLLICKERERDRRATATTTTTVELQPPVHHRAPAETEFKHYIELLARGVIKCLFGILSGNDFGMKVDAIAAIAQLTQDDHSRLTLCKPPLLRALKEFAFHPLVQTRSNIAQIVANFAERPENILKLVDEGMLAILVKYVCPISRNNDVLVEATRAIAAMSMVHVTRNKLVESGVLGTLLQFSKSPSTSPQVRAFAATAIRNLRHDAAALCIQSIYRGWCVRVHHARSIITRKRRVRKMTSVRKIQLQHDDQSIAAVMERLADQHKKEQQLK